MSNQENNKTGKAREMSNSPEKREDHVEKSEKTKKFSPDFVKKLKDNKNKSLLLPVYTKKR